MNNFTVEFEYRGRTWQENFEARNFAHAFSKCVDKYPEAMLIGAEVRGTGVSRGMIMSCKAPSRVRIEPAPAEKAEQQEMRIETDH